MVDELKTEDAVEIERIVRKIGALVCTPSSISDIYDLGVYRSAITRRDPMKLWVLLDNNIVTQVVSFLSGARKTRTPLSEEMKKICAIMAFLIHARIDINPAVALYERPEYLNNPDKVTQDYFFRIADHLPAQIFADLALNRTCRIPEKHFIAAQREVDSNPLTQKNIKRINYAYEKDHAFKMLHANLLKAWLISHQAGAPNQRLQRFLDWKENELVSDYVGLIFALIYLSKKRIGGMIKHCDSSDRHLVLKEIENSTWDMYYLAFLEKLHETANGSQIWFFCTRDQVLLKIASHRDAVATERIDAFIKEYYTGEGVEAFKNYMNQIKCRSDRAGHIAKVCANIDSIVDELINAVAVCP
jgi:hypothetical protein